MVYVLYSTVYLKICTHTCNAMCYMQVYLNNLQICTFLSTKLIMDRLHVISKHINLYVALQYISNMGVIHVQMSIHDLIQCS